MSETLKDKALLARQSREDIISALVAAGYEADGTTPITKVCDYIRWTNGLLDVSIAGTAKDGTDAFYTLSEWSALNDNTKMQYTVYGIRVRAYGRSIVVALSNTTTAQVAWGKQGAFPGVTLCTTSAQLEANDDGYAITKQMVENATCAKYALQAAAAWNYKAHDSDTHQWYMPSLVEAMIVQMFANDINTAFKAVSGATDIPNALWSCNLYDASNAHAACYNGMATMLVYKDSITLTWGIPAFVRPVCKAE